MRTWFTCNLHLSGTPTLTWPSLPVDTTLSGSSSSSSIMSSGVPLLHGSLPSKAATVVVAEGIPPVSCRLVEKIRKWEYVNLMDLLKDPSTEHLVLVNGQLILIKGPVVQRLFQTYSPGFKPSAYLWLSSCHLKTPLKRRQQVWLLMATLSSRCQKTFRDHSGPNMIKTSMNGQQQKAFENGGS